MTDAPTLVARGLSLGYPRRRVIDGLDIAIAPGRVTVVIGANASGKSTLLGGFARLHRPLAGSITLGDRDIHTIPRREFARAVGLLPQQPIAPEGTPVGELVARGRHPHRGVLARWSPEDTRRVDRAMALADVAALADRPMGDLSGGQRQRAWIAMSLAQDPRILLLDEPTTFLDISHQIEVLDLMRRLNRETGTTIVAVLHELNLAARYADDLVVMCDGRILAHGPASDVLTREIVAEAFGLDAVVTDDPLSHTPLVLPVPHTGSEVPAPFPDAVRVTTERTTS